jgi:hypothetical protein
VVLTWANDFVGFTDGPTLGTTASRDSARKSNSNSYDARGHSGLVWLGKPLVKNPSSSIGPVKPDKYDVGIIIRINLLEIQNDHLWE